MDWIIIVAGSMAVICIISLGLGCITRKEVFLQISFFSCIAFGVFSIITALVEAFA